MSIYYLALIEEEVYFLPLKFLNFFAVHLDASKVELRMHAIDFKFKEAANSIFHNRFFENAKEDKSLVGVKIKVSSHQLRSFYR